MGEEVIENSAKSKQKKEKIKQIKSLVIFIAVITALVGFGVHFHSNNEPNHKKTEAFFNARKSPDSYQEYLKDEESAKKKAERNIFLQK